MGYVQPGRYSEGRQRHRTLVDLPRMLSTFILLRRGETQRDGAIGMGLCLAGIHPAVLQLDEPDLRPI